MQLKTKVQIGFIIFLLIGIIFDIIFIPIYFKDESMYNTFMCMYGNLFNSVFIVLIELVLLSLTYFSYMIYIELYTRKDRRYSFFRFLMYNRNLFWHELFFPTLKEDANYMRLINITRLLLLMTIIGFIAWFSIAIPCSRFF